MLFNCQFLESRWHLLWAFDWRWRAVSQIEAGFVPILLGMRKAAHRGPEGKRCQIADNPLRNGIVTLTGARYFKIELSDRPHRSLLLVCQNISAEPAKYA